MSRHHYLHLILVTVLLATACSSTRKSTERAKAKAQKHLARAIWLDPSILETNEAKLFLPADSAQLPNILPQQPTNMDVDSIIAACQQLTEAMQAERDLFASALLQRDHPITAQNAIVKIQRAACTYPPFTYDHPLFTFSIPGGATLSPSIIVKERQVTVPCPPQVNHQTVVRHGVATWYRSGFWISSAIALIILYFTFRSILRGLRINEPHG